MLFLLTYSFAFINDFKLVRFNSLIEQTIDQNSSTFLIKIVFFLQLFTTLLRTLPMNLKIAIWGSTLAVTRTNYLEAIVRD